MRAKWRVPLIVGVSVAGPFWVSSLTAATVAMTVAVALMLRVTTF